MKACDLLLDHLDAAVAGTLAPELAAHLADCAECRLAVERAQGLAEGERVFRSVRAPESLKLRLKTLPRLARACEQALDLVNLALEGELSEENRAALVGHLRECPSCNAFWEAVATLREVGTSVRSPGRLRAAIAIPPSRRLGVRKQKRFLDLRLATAAAYLIAALTVTLLSNPATLARASSERMETAATYASAAVQNRFSSYARNALEAAAAAEGWVRDHAVKAWEKAKTLVGGKHQNPATSDNVGKDGGRT